MASDSGTHAVAASTPAGVSVEIFPLGEIPLFNPDLEPCPPNAVTRFRARVGQADGMIIASPEYAHGISGVLKNALDWLVGYEGFAGMPVQVFNTAPRAHHGEAALREVLATMSAQLIDEHSIATPGDYPVLVKLLASKGSAS